MEWDAGTVLTAVKIFFWYFWPFLLACAIGALWAAGERPEGHEGD